MTHTAACVTRPRLSRLALLSHNLGPLAAAGIASSFPQSRRAWCNLCPPFARSQVARGRLPYAIHWPSSNHQGMRPPPPRPSEAACCHRSRFALGCGQTSLGALIFYFLEVPIVIYGGFGLVQLLVKIPVINRHTHPA